jgi:secondary thiamine-phosphate synthase enzyme
MRYWQHEVKGHEEFTDITDIVQSDLDEVLPDTYTLGGIREGLCIVYSTHTTACVRLLEPESLLKQDMHDFFERLAPSSCYYRHDDIEHRDVPPEERRNGFSHLRAMLMNHQEIIPIIDGKLDLGKWQRIFYIECDFHPPIRDDREFRVIIVRG